MKYAGYGLAITGMLVGLYLTVIGYLGMTSSDLHDPRKNYLIFGVLALFGSLVVFIITRVIDKQRG